MSYKTVTTAGTVFLLAKLWKLGGTRYEGVISCPLISRIEKWCAGNCVEGSGCGLFWGTFEALSRGTEENQEVFSENNLQSCRDSGQAILQCLTLMSWYLMHVFSVTYRLLADLLYMACRSYTRQQFHLLHGFLWTLRALGAQNVFSNFAVSGFLALQLTAW